MIKQLRASVARHRWKRAIAVVTLSCRLGGGKRWATYIFYFNIIIFLHSYRDGYIFRPNDFYLFTHTPLLRARAPIRRPEWKTAVPGFKDGKRNRFVDMKKLEGEVSRLFGSREFHQGTIMHNLIESSESKRFM